MKSNVASIAALLIFCAGFNFGLFAQVTAVQHGSSIHVSIDGKYFTQYIFSQDEKYPYFYPVNGPSGASVTSARNGTYPHHSSLFFGCDRVNGGNYWQEELHRGQIIGLQTKILDTDSSKVVIAQECIWTRPDAKSPIKDFRTITISAPADDVYQLDFDIEMEMLMDVEIERTNHSLFSARMDPDLAVINGGNMVNAQGEQGEKETFGKASAWMDYYGSRGDFNEGLAVLQHPENAWFPAPWFTRDYGFISPTPMYWPEDEEQGTQLSKGQKVILRYRVLIHKGTTQEAKIAEAYDRYCQE